MQNSTNNSQATNSSTSSTAAYAQSPQQILQNPSAHVQQQQQQPTLVADAITAQMQTKDTTLTKIFVGGLPYHTNDQSLRQFFQKFGNIEEAVVITDRTTGKSRGYGFVTMDTKEAAALAVYDPNPIIDGRKANVNLAYLGVKSRIAQPTGFLPVTIGRYPIQATAFGFPQIYCQPSLQAAAPIPASIYQPSLVAAQAASPSSFLLQQQTAAASNNSNSAAALLDFAAFEQQQQQQQQQPLPHQQQQQLTSQQQHYIQMNGGSAATAAAVIQAANAFSLMNAAAAAAAAAAQNNATGATSPPATASVPNTAPHNAFFSFPATAATAHPANHVVNTFQSH